VVVPEVQGEVEGKASALPRLDLRHPAAGGRGVVAEESEFGLREVDPSDRKVVGLEYWRASERLPADLLRMLPAPSVGVAG
jgi:hypothetical protein